MIWNDEENRGAVVAFLVQRFRTTMYSLVRKENMDTSSLEERAKEFAELRNAASLAELPALFTLFSEYEKALRSRIAYGDEETARRVGETELIYLRRKELTLKGRKEDFNQLELFELYEEYSEQEEAILRKISAIRGVDLLEELLRIRDASEKEHQEYYRAMWESLDALQERILKEAPSVGIVEVRLLKRSVQKAWEEAGNS